MGLGTLQFVVILLIESHSFGMKAKRCLKGSDKGRVRLKMGKKSEEKKNGRKILRIVEMVLRTASKYCQANTKGRRMRRKTGPS